MLQSMPAIGRTILLLLFYSGVSLADDWQRIHSFNQTAMAVVTVSGDGTLLVAGYEGGPLFRSSDGGQEWTETASGAGSWSAIASSGDGRITIAQRWTDGMLISTNHGMNWSQIHGIPNAEWNGLAAAFDGVTWFASTNNPNAVYSSTDGGMSWDKCLSAPNISVDDYWVGVACSYDCSVVYSGTANGLVYGSFNGGHTWTLRKNLAYPLSSIAASQDGSRVITDVYQGTLYLSSDFASTFFPTQAPINAWEVLSATSDCSRVYASDDSSNIWSFTGLFLRLPETNGPLKMRITTTVQSSSRVTNRLVSYGLTYESV